MDSDDVAISNRFEQQMKFLNDNLDVDIVGGNISEFIDDENNIVGYRKVPSSDSKIKKFMKKRCPFNHMTVMFKKQSVLNAGNYQDWHFNEDYYLWIRMYEKHLVFANLNKVLVNVRTGQEQYRRRGGWRYFKSEIKLQEYMLKKHIISPLIFIANCIKRFIIQVTMPSCIRGFFIKSFCRKSRVSN